MVGRAVSTSIRRGTWGGSPAYRVVAISILVMRGVRKLVRREPEVVRRIRLGLDQRCRLQFVVVVVVDHSATSTLQRG